MAERIVKESPQSTWRIIQPRSRWWTVQKLSKQHLRSLLAGMLLITIALYVGLPNLAVRKTVSALPDLSIRTEESFKSIFITLNVDEAANEVTVQELITLNLLGKQVKAGFVRELPKSLPTRAEKPITPSYELLSASIRFPQNDEFIPLKLRTENTNRALRLFLDRDKKPMPPGIYEYSLSYKVGGIIEREKDYHSLIWQAFQSMPITVENVQITVVPPKDYKPGSFKGKTRYGFLEIEPKRVRHLMADGPQAVVAKTQSHEVLVASTIPGIERAFFINASWQNLSAGGL